VSNVMKLGTQGQVHVEVHASPTDVYDTVSDISRMGAWSPECRHCAWIDGATGPAVGARFKGTNQHGVARWSTKARIVTADPGQEFAFVTLHLGRDMTKWTYEFSPAGDVTTVTESFEMLHDMPWYFRVTDRVLMGVKDRKADLETNMGETLRRLKTATENRNLAS
jgi:Polyketide cyclase / dehydrase and lipid transport